MSGCVPISAGRCPSRWYSPHRAACPLPPACPHQALHLNLHPNHHLPQDKIMEIASFEKFLLDKIKVDGKTGAWERRSLQGGGLQQWRLRQ